MNSNKKINVLVVPDLFPKFKGDVQGIFVLDYLSATESKCNNNVLFGRIKGDKKGLVVQKENGYDVFRFSLTTKKIPKILKPVFYLFWFVKGYRIGKKITGIDIIHAHGSILSGTLSYLLSKKLGVPFIITEHQGPFSMTSETFWKRTWTKYIMQKANAVLTVSNHLKLEILNAGIIPKQIFVTYNPVDTDLFKLKNNHSTRKILFVGRLDNFKGALRCLKAFEIIAPIHPDWTFTIVGAGEDYTPIESYLKQNPLLQPKVFLRGQLSKAEIAVEMQSADFFVFPSKHESFGLVIAEALSTGLPVIVGNETAPKEFVDKENGLIVPYDDIDEISKVMSTLIQSHNQYNPQLIRNQIIEKFGLVSFGKKITDIYLTIMNKS